MTGAALTVFYDAECGVCRLTSLALARLDWRRRLRFVPLQAYTEAEPTRADLTRELHVRDATARWSRGGGAAIRIARELPLLVPLALLGSLPGVRGIVDAAYRLVAGNRHHIGRLLRIR